MRNDLVIGGLGGQGIVISTKLIGAAATRAGLYSSHYAAYSGEVRGGWVECTLAVSDLPVDTPPMVGLCRTAAVMHPNSFDRTRTRLMHGGLLIVNSSLVESYPDVPEAHTVLSMPATAMGEQLGAEMAGSMCVLGAYIELSQLVDRQLVKDLLAEILPPYRHNLLDIDRKALDAGAQYARDHVSPNVASAIYEFALVGGN